MVLLCMQVDRLSSQQLPALEQLGAQLRGMYPFGHTFALSARHGTGVPQLREFLLAQCVLTLPLFFALHMVHCRVLAVRHGSSM